MKELRLNALVVRQPIGEFLIASIKAKDLVDISFRDIRELIQNDAGIDTYLGIQREVSAKRMREIREYVTGDDATFPTAVILAVDSRCAEYNLETKELVLSEFIPEEGSDEEHIPFGKIAKIIDGQHRIAAFMNDDEKYNYDLDFDDRSFDINIAVFIGADLPEQANIFATVNLAQTKVNRSLVYDLTSLAKTPSPQKTCHNVAVVLDQEDSSPFYKRIKRLGVATKGRKNEPLTQASFVESLVKFISTNPVSDRSTLLSGKALPYAKNNDLIKTPFRNLFIAGKDVDIAKIIYNYFLAVKKKWPESWEATGVTGNLLPKSNAFKALMVYLKDDVYVNCVGLENIGKVPTIDDFYKYFEGIELTDKDFTTRNFAPGSGGQSMFLKMLRNEVLLQDML